MIDTLNFTYYGFVNYQAVSYHLERCKHTYKGVKGKFGNLIVHANPHKIEVKGSIAKYVYNGCNIKGLQMQKVNETIKLLSDTFDYNLFEAKVNRIDVGTSVTLYEAPANYRALFSYKPNYYRNDYPNTTYFHTATDNKVLAFYDKCKVNKLLKYESRITDNRTLKQALKINNKPTVADVINSNNILLKQYKNAYLRVRKSQLVEMSGIPNGITDVTNYLWALAANDPLQRQNLEAQIKQNQDKKKRYEMRKKLRSAEKYRFNENYDLIKELDSKVIETYESYLI